MNDTMPTRDVIVNTFHRGPDGYYHSSEPERLMWEALTVSEAEHGYFSASTNAIRRAWVIVHRIDIAAALAAQFAGVEQ